MATSDTPRRPVATGGCQCGAIRYALFAEPEGSGICHCRMCQKAGGNFFMAATGVRRDDFAITRGEPASFRSSARLARGFCRDCGTPLTFVYDGRDRVAVTVGSLDHPERIAPDVQEGVESRLPAFMTLHALREEASTPLPDNPSRQAPDHD